MQALLVNMSAVSCEDLLTAGCGTRFPVIAVPCEVYFRYCWHSVPVHWHLGCIRYHSNGCLHVSVKTAYYHCCPDVNEFRTIVNADNQSRVILLGQSDYINASYVNVSD